MLKLDGTITFGARYADWAVTTPILPTGLVTTAHESVYGRRGQPVEIAPVYVLLASQEGSLINGEVYGVTGGAGIA